MIEVIPNQPWIFEDRPETTDCKKTDPACNKIADGDDIYIQFKTDACGSPLLCDQDFGSAIGNLVTNGDFNGSAAGWTLGATWSYNADHYMDSNDTVGSFLTQSIPAINEDECYVVVFTVTNYVSGTLTPQVGGVGGTGVTANGVYRQVIVAGNSGELRFAATGNPNEFSLSNVQLYSMGACWCPDNGNLYSTANQVGLFCHVPGSETTITQVTVTPPIIISHLYRVQITVSNRTAGFVYAIVGTSTQSEHFVGNGSFTDYVLADGNNNFQIVMSSDFDGCITDVLVYEFPTSVNMGVVDENGDLVQDLTAYGQYRDNRVTLHVNTSDFSFDHGCYRFFYADPCEMAPEPVISNCFSWQEEHPKTRYVTAIDRSDTDPDTRYSYGFQWYQNTFYLIQRVECNFRRPGKNTKANTGRYSTGVRFRSYAEKAKHWELVIVGLDETQHDAMDTMWGCKNIEIDGVGYFSDYDEYNPLWDELGAENIADVKIEVTRKDDIIFSDNCNR